MKWKMFEMFQTTNRICSQFGGQFDFLIAMTSPYVSWLKVKTGILGVAKPSQSCEMFYTHPVMENLINGDSLWTEPEKSRNLNWIKLVDIPKI